MWTRVSDRRVRTGAFLVFILVLAAIPGGGVSAAEIRLFAAASTATAVQDVIDLYGRRDPQDRVLASFASSSTLAKQIVNGAPADIFLSASRQWMEYVLAAGAAERASVVELLGNRLVLIAPAATSWTLEIAPGMDLAGRLGGGYLAMGDPDHVPAGIYAREALSALGVWPSLADRIARAANVRAALVLVERDEAAAGIVYATDAAISDRVRSVGTFPPNSHSPIVYPAVLINVDAGSSVHRFFAYLSSPEAAEAWTRRGFSLIKRQTAD